MRKERPNWTYYTLSDAQFVGQRLDNFLLGRVPDLTRALLYKCIRKKDIRINDQRTQHGYRLCLGDKISLYRMEVLHNEVKNVPQANWLKFAIIYEDEDMLVINKPAGMAVHSGSGLDYGVVDVCRQYTNLPELSLVHRLDRQTSGVLLMAKHRKSMRLLSDLLARRQWQKYYNAIVEGEWAQPLQREGGKIS